MGMFIALVYNPVPYGYKSMVGVCVCGVCVRCVCVRACVCVCACVCMILNVDLFMCMKCMNTNNKGVCMDALRVWMLRYNEWEILVYLFPLCSKVSIPCKMRSSRRYKVQSNHEGSLLKQSKSSNILQAFSKLIYWNVYVRPLHQLEFNA